VADPAIACEGLTYTYLRGTPRETVALRGIDLVIRAGEMLAIIGPTGSGKSTLVQHFNGLLRPTAGVVRVDGEDLWGPNTNRRRARQRVGLVFQAPEAQLFEETVRRDVAFGPRNLALSEDVVAGRVEEALRQVGLDPARFGDRSPFELSGGEKRRVAIAGVLAMRPQVLVLDEPTAGLDPKGREELLARIAGLHRQGMTVVVISHDMDIVASLAGRVIVLHEGRILLEGAPRDVFARDAELRAIGFTAPQATRLARLLRERGVPLDDVLTIDEARRALKPLVGGAGRGAH